MRFKATKRDNPTLTPCELPKPKEAPIPLRETSSAVNRKDRVNFLIRTIQQVFFELINKRRFLTHNPVNKTSLKNTANSFCNILNAQKFSDQEVVDILVQKIPLVLGVYGPNSLMIKDLESAIEDYKAKPRSSG